jgi:hypothetical protein
MKRLHRCNLHQGLRAQILVAPGLDNAGGYIAEPAQLVPCLSYQLIAVSNE